MRLPASMAIFFMGALIVTATPVAADTIPLNISFSSNDPDLNFYTQNADFTLPAGFSNASLNITTFYIDDRGVLQLNGATVASTGIFGGGPGTMVFTSGGLEDPFTFQYGNSGAFTSITTGFVTGLNTLQVIVNDTGTGIVGTLGGGTPFPTGVIFAATVTYEVAQVPLGAASPLFTIGLGALGLLAWRRKRKGIAAA
jgi:hypothetical protein